MAAPALAHLRSALGSAGLRTSTAQAAPINADAAVAAPNADPIASQYQIVDAGPAVARGEERKKKSAPGTKPAAAPTGTASTAARQYR